MPHFALFFCIGRGQGATGDRAGWVRSEWGPSRLPICCHSQVQGSRRCHARHGRIRPILLTGAVAVELRLLDECKVVFLTPEFLVKQERRETTASRGRETRRLRPPNRRESAPPRDRPTQELCRATGFPPEVPHIKAAPRLALPMRKILPECPIQLCKTFPGARSSATDSDLGALGSGILLALASCGPSRNLGLVGCRTREWEE